MHMKNRQSRRRRRRRRRKRSQTFSKIDLLSCWRPPESAPGHVTVYKSVLGHMTVTKY
jgi:hypothetical protein